MFLVTAPTRRRDCCHFSDLVLTRLFVTIGLQVIGVGVASAAKASKSWRAPQPQQRVYLLLARTTCKGTEKNPRSSAPAPQCIHAHRWSEPTLKCTRPSMHPCSQVVRTHAQVHPLINASMPTDGKNPLSSAPAHQRFHAHRW